MQRTVPFYSQHWNLSNWSQLGFESYNDAEFWQKSCCGVLCLKMIVDGSHKAHGEPVSFGVIDYIKTGLRIGAYTEKHGWSHAGLVELAKYLGFTAEKKEVQSKQLKDLLLQGYLPIVSVKWALKSTKTLKEKLFFWKKFGGHLAVIIGYEEEGQELTGFYIHHTSKIKKENWESRFVALKNFSSSYTGRCIVVKAF